jgi:ribosomal protein S10
MLFCLILNFVNFFHELTRHLRNTVIENPYAVIDGHLPHGAFGSKWKTGQIDTAIIRPSGEIRTIISGAVIGHCLRSGEPVHEVHRLPSISHPTTIRIRPHTEKDTHGRYKKRPYPRRIRPPKKKTMRISKALQILDIRMPKVARSTPIFENAEFRLKLSPIYRITDSPRDRV